MATTKQPIENREHVATTKQPIENREQVATTKQPIENREQVATTKQPIENREQVRRSNFNYIGFCLPNDYNYIVSIGKIDQDRFLNVTQKRCSPFTLFILPHIRPGSICTTA